MGLFSSIGKFIFGDPTKGIEKATQQKLGFQQKGVDYSRSVLDPLVERREEAAGSLMGFYNDPEQQAQFYQDAQDSPTFDYLQGAGEESILRNAAATGGVRGGAVNPALAMNTANITSGLVNQRLQGLQGFAGQQIDPRIISDQYTGMGTTRAGGTTAKTQAEQDLAGQAINLGFKAFGAF